jgi:hypothetical protein
MAQQVQLLPFRRNTRQRIKQVQAAQAFTTLGSTINYQLDRVGLLNYLVLIVRAQVTLSSAGAFADLGPWSLIDRVRVDLNLGNMNLVDISGYQLYQLNKMLFRGWAPDGGGNWTPNANSYTAGVANGANNWVLPLIIPISANPGSQFDTGLISLQAPEVQVNVQVRINSSGANFVTNYSSIANATVELHQCYFEYPDPNYVMLPPGQVVRTVEYSQPVTATGTNTWTIDRQGILLQLCSLFRANGARSDGFDRVQLVANINDTIYDETLSLIKIKNEFDQSLPSSTGSFNLDLWHAIESLSCGDDRDVIDTEVLTTLQWILTVSSGTTLGSGNNYFNTARRILVDFAQPGLGPAI